MKYSYEAIKNIIDRSLSEQGRLILSIDGCCSSGKTTLANRLAADCGGDLIHADDFFLPPALRTQKRLQEPGGNIHYERFYDQIIAPLLSARGPAPAQSAAADIGPAPARSAAADIGSKAASGTGNGFPILHWQHFMCSTLSYSPDLCCTTGRPLLIIEGAYCMRPEFRPAYDLRLFLTTSYENQLARIRKRNGAERLAAFSEKWIPLENEYFSFYQIPQQCHFQIET